MGGDRTHDTVTEKTGQGSTGWNPVGFAEAKEEK
jgi:hypothetical protein